MAMASMVSVTLLTIENKINTAFDAWRPKQSAKEKGGPDNMDRAPTQLNREDVLRTRRGYWRLKRVQDVILSAIAIVTFSPVMLVTMIAILIDDPSGSPVYIQNRVGRDGKIFRFYKFRSMCRNADQQLDELMAENEMDGPVFKIKADPRITQVGRFIRKTCIDELPQLINVLKGDMSLVGPRPALPREVEQYGDYEMQRLYVTPGLTCYWQTMPDKNSLIFSEWMELDLKYIQERSFLVDWKIMFRTVKVVFQKEGC